MAEIWYRIDFMMNVGEVEVVKETEHFVTVREQIKDRLYGDRIRETRYAKASHFDCYFQTKRDAYQYLVNKYSSAVESTKTLLAEAECKLAEAISNLAKCESENDGRS